MPTIEEILRAAKEAGASDVHLTVGIPPKMRVNGNLITMDYPRMLPADTLEVLVNIMTEVQRERFEERGEYDMSFSIPNCGRYRVNAYKQRGSVALAFRLVGTVVPSPEELGANFWNLALNDKPVANCYIVDKRLSCAYYKSRIFMCPWCLQFVHIF